MYRTYFFIYLLFFFISCENQNTVENNFSLLEEISVKENNFEKRVFKNDLYQVSHRTEIPEYVGKIYQLKANSEDIYFNDTESIYRYKNKKFTVIYTPNKGQGPKEVPQIFRFDIRDEMIAIAGHPDLRILLHQLQSDTSKLIMTEYRGNVLIDKDHNFYGEHSGNISSYMFTKFNSYGDSVGSFGHFFNNQDRSLNMFDLYWEYNSKHDLIIIGFMYAGYYIAIDSNGDIIYAVNSIHNAGRLPTMVNNGGMRYVDDEGKIVMSALSTYEDEIHVYTAKAMNKNKKIYGALIDVLDVTTGAYKFSYILEEILHWPILLMNEYTLISVTEGYELVTWKRTTE